MRFNYYLKEGFSNLFKNKKSTLASMITMMSTLIILGIFLLFSMNIGDAIKALKQNQGMHVFILVETKEDRIKEIGDEIKKIDYVNSVTFKSREEGLKDLKKQFKDSPALTEGIDNPEFLPDSYIVKLTDITKASEVKGKIEKIKDVEEVKDQQTIVNTLIGISKMGSTIGFVLTAVLVIVSVLIISNTIRLTVAARRREISIMKYVGATDGFIKTPFVIEGAFIGFIASFIAIIILGLMYEALIANVASTITGVSMATGGEGDTISISLLPYKNIVGQILLIFMIISIGLGVIASSISMKKYLEV